MNYLFTSESVSEGHPDKVADQISDAVLDTLLAQDPEAKVACETLVTTGQVVVAVLKQNVRTERTPATWRRAALRQCGGPRGSPHAGKTSHRRGP